MGATISYLGGWLSYYFSAGPIATQSKLSKVVVLFRHGARGPSEGSLKPFKAATKNSPEDEWGPLEVELLSPVGEQQMFNLGEWFRKVYFQEMHPNFLPETVDDSILRWRSSKIDRVMHSGEHFWKGFGVPLEDPQPFHDDEDPDNYFRVWNHDKAYLEAVKELKHGSDFVEKGKEELEFLDEINKLYGIDPSKYGPEEKLAQMTYYYEVLECERYFASPKKSISGLLTQEQQHHVEELAHWVWEKRFFLPGFGKVIGGNLLQNLKEELFDTQVKFSAYSCHDYSMLSLLAAMNKDKYEGRTFGFATYLIFEVYSDANNQPVEIKALLNNYPYDFQKSPTELHWKPIELFSSQELLRLFSESQ